jgi:hypothetical protein
MSTEREREVGRGVAIVIDTHHDAVVGRSRGRGHAGRCSAPT